MHPPFSFDLFADTLAIEINAPILDVESLSRVLDAIDNCIMSTNIENQVFFTSLVIKNKKIILKDTASSGRGTSLAKIFTLIKNVGKFKLIAQVLPLPEDGSRRKTAIT
jgi:hypothetical protein